MSPTPSSNWLLTDNEIEAYYNQSILKETLYVCYCNKVRSITNHCNTITRSSYCKPLLKKNKEKNNLLMKVRSVSKAVNPSRRYFGHGETDDFPCEKFLRSQHPRWSSLKKWTFFVTFNKTYLNDKTLLKKIRTTKLTTKTVDLTWDWQIVPDTI